MEETKDLQELLERMEKSNQEQAKYARLQCIFSAAAAVCCIAVLVVVLSLLPQVHTAAKKIDTVLTNVEQVSQELAQADIAGVMTDLEEVTRQMAAADLDGLADGVSDLVSTSQTSVEEALDKLNAIDLETLNKAIQDLATVVEPMAKLLGRFG